MLLTGNITIFLSVTCYRYVCKCLGPSPYPIRIFILIRIQQKVRLLPNRIWLLFKVKNLHIKLYTSVPWVNYLFVMLPGKPLIGFHSVTGAIIAGRYTFFPIYRYSIKKIPVVFCLLNMEC
jgi:hypothetical protein